MGWAHGDGRAGRWTVLHVPGSQELVTGGRRLSPGSLCPMGRRVHMVTRVPEGPEEASVPCSWSPFRGWRCWLPDLCTVASKATSVTLLLSLLLTLSPHVYVLSNRLQCASAARRHTAPASPPGDLDLSDVGTKDKCGEEAAGGHAGGPA